MTNRRFDSSHGAGASFIDDSGLFCLPGGISHADSLDDLQLIVGATGDPLQVVPEIVCERGGFVGDRRQFGRPKPTCHPGGAIDGKAERRNRQ